MSSSRPRKAQMSEPLPCPECDAVRMVHVVENCRLDDGLLVQQLPHFKCGACGARFFDDEAMHCIQAERAKRQMHHAM